VKIELSGESSLRLTWTPSGLHVDLVSATSPREIPSLLLELIELETPQVDFQTVERRLKGYQ
jgi:hypothetical protein